MSLVPGELRAWTRHVVSRSRRLASRSNRGLFVELARANIKVSDHNSVLGAVWSLLGPLVMLAVLYAIFKSRFGQDVPAYGLFLLVGIVTVNAFIAITRYLLMALHTHRVTFLNATVPRETFMAGYLFLFVYKLGVELLFCAGLALVLGLLPWERVAWTLPLVAAFLACVVGIGLLLALVYSRLRDVEYLWVLVTRLIFFVTPVFYTLESLPPNTARAIYWLNPLTPFLVALRACLMSSQPLEPRVYAHSLVLGAGCFAVGYAAFLRWENRAVERA